MTYSKALPQWNKTAIAPAQSKMDAGWGSDEKPPASIFNWFFNTTYQALQELQQKSMGPITEIANGNADNIGNTTGFYLLSGTPVNAPTSDADYIVLNLVNDATGSKKTQLAFNATTADMYRRKLQTSIWTVWTKIATADLAQMFKLTNDDGSLKTSSTTDLNSFTTPGRYYISGTQTANKPSGLTNGLLEVNKNGGETYQRITLLGPTTNGVQWFRQYNGISWTSWTQKVDLSTNGQLTVPNQSNVSATKTSVGNLSSGVDVKVINYTTTYRDTQTEFNATAGEVTIKENGVYLVEVQAIFGGVLSNNVYIKLYRNGAAWITITGGTSQAILYGQVQAQCVAGDVLSVYILQNSGSTGTLNTFKLEMVKLS